MLGFISIGHKWQGSKSGELQEISQGLQDKAVLGSRRKEISNYFLYDFKNKWRI